MSAAVRSAFEYLTSAVTEANLAEFHQRIGSLLSVYMLGGISPVELVNQVTALYLRTQEANRRLQEPTNDQPNEHMPEVLSQ